MQKSCEYRLKISSNKVDHGVIVLNSTTPLSEFSTPIRLAKHQPTLQDAEQEDNVQSGRRIYKRKTKIVSSDQKTEPEKQATSFILEDFDGQHSLIGKEEEGQEGHYIFLVNQGNEFRMLLVQSWFKFNPNKAWLSKGPVKVDVHEGHPTSVHGEPSLDLEYNDTFDIQPHHDMRLSAAGKQISRIVKHLDKSNQYVWEEDHDPYASEEEEVVERQDLETSFKTREEGEQPTVSLKRHIDALKDTTLLTKDDVIDVLKKGPIRTRDLIVSLKDKLRSVPSNKDRLKDILKEVAIVHGREPDTSTTEKLLELRKDMF